MGTAKLSTTENDQRITTRIHVALHMPQTVQLLHPHDVTDSYRRFGIQEFGRAVGVVCRDAKADNPYADWMLVQIEDKMEAVSRMIEETGQSFDELMAEMVEEGIEVDLAAAEQHQAEVFSFGSPYPYAALRMVRHLDDVLRLGLTLVHIGALSNRDRKEQVKPLMRGMRQLWSMPFRYKHTEISRSRLDYQDPELIAELEQRLGGSLPQEVLDGSRRGRYAPDIQTVQPTPSKTAELVEA